MQRVGALGAKPPAFAHDALLLGTEGKLSKRLGSLGMASLREEGIEPIALVALLARLGTSDPIDPVTSPAPLIESTDFARSRRAPARFDADELALLTQNIRQTPPYVEVASRRPPPSNHATSQEQSEGKE